jgi:hypothetical protein
MRGLVARSVNGDMISVRSLVVPLFFNPPLAGHGQSIVRRRSAANLLVSPMQQTSLQREFGLERRV